MTHARTRFRPALTLLATVALVLPAAAQPAAAAAADNGIRADVEYLASGDLEGRLTGSPGEKKAAEYIERRLAEIGARPLPGHGGFRVPFEFTAGVEDAGSYLALAAAEGREVRFDGDAVQALSFSDSGEVSAPVVFAGYGLVVPEGQGVAYDSYVGVDVDGKIALVLRYFPEDADQDTRAVLARYAGLRYKALHARQNGAVGMIVVTGPRSPNAGETVAMSFDTAIAGSGLVAASVDGEVAAKLFATAGKQIEAVQKSFDDANPHVTGFALEGVEVKLHVDVVRERREGANLVGYLPANDNGDGNGGAAADEPWIVLGAHYDHLGRG
ncbi:MAG TPA: PA domain-containing protein, partial [Thermoanaerobaculia bacterium]|nr:PA domain-containing protein [Thermoanaerobaculia bacterium]